jgi:hypothetical protein
MSITIEGIVEQSAMGAGTWAFVTDDATYELHSASPEELLQPGMRAKVTGRIRDDVMSFAMIGPILEVNSFEPL